MRKFWVFVGFSLISASVIAEPDQIDVVGLVPGVTTFEQYKQVGFNNGSEVGLIEIGGYKLMCLAKFRNKLLDTLRCNTGEKLSNASNLEIHETLTKGFTAKLGEPTANTNNPGKNGFGVEYTVSTVAWIDKQGNYLSLQNMDGRTDIGTLMLVSSTKVKEVKEITNHQESTRKF